MATYQVRINDSGEKVLSEPLSGLEGEIATSEAPGVVRPDGKTVRVDNTGVLSAIGGNLLLNSEEWITESGTWVAKATGWHEVFLISGGAGALVHTNGGRFMTGGESGKYDRIFVYLKEGQEVPVTIGAGGAGLVTAASTTQWRPAGGNTTFGGHSPRFHNSFPGPWAYAPTTYAYVPGGGFGARPSVGEGQPLFYGGGGSGYSSSSSGSTATNGRQGAVRVCWYDPAKAAGPTE